MSYSDTNKSNVDATWSRCRHDHLSPSKMELMRNFSLDGNDDKCALARWKAKHRYRISGSPISRVHPAKTEELPSQLDLQLRADADPAIHETLTSFDALISAGRGISPESSVP